jgi:hypothetical protein
MLEDDGVVTVARAKAERTSEPLRGGRAYSCSLILLAAGPSNR